MNTDTHPVNDNIDDTEGDDYQYLTVLVKQRFNYHPTYRCPAETRVEIGQRVSVRLRGRLTTAFILSISTNCELEKVLDIEAILDPHSSVSEPMLSLYQWVSQYYHSPLNVALFCFLPNYLLRPQALPTNRQWTISASASDSQISDRAHKQKALFKAIESGVADEVSLNQLLATGWRTAAKKLQQLGLIEVAEISLFQSESNNNTVSTQHFVFDHSITLNKEQQTATEQVCNDLRDRPQYHAYMLYGVTGSGKTEVFFRIMEQVIAAGKQVLYLVPEIALTEQTSQRIASHFQQQDIVFLHSAVSDKQKCLNWFAARNGRADIIVGTRSAVMSEAPRLGLIVIDEEHDLSYKQQDSFAYNARDIANMRAKRANIPIILASATPSLETYHKANTQQYQTLLLKQRAASQSLPRIHLADMRSQPADAVIGQQLKQAMQACLANKQQVLIFLNRRGFAPIMLCNHCGWSAHCEACERPMTYHRNPSRAICHHCETIQTLSDQCPQCGQTELTSIGVGTQRLEDYCSAHFNNIPVIRIDRDSTQNKGQLSTLLRQVHTGEPCIIVGTQMLAKGHDFQHVNLVGVIDVDSALLSIDFRAHEHLAQLMTQVAGRSGRNEQSQNAQVLIQTRMPEHPLLQQIKQQDYARIADELLATRQLYQLPPFRHQCLIRAQSNQQQSNLNALQTLLQPFKASITDTEKNQQETESPQLHTFGPLASQYAKTAGVYSAYALMSCDDRQTLHRHASQLNQQISQNKQKFIRFSIELDPIYF